MGYTVFKFNWCRRSKARESREGENNTSLSIFVSQTPRISSVGIFLGVGTVGASSVAGGDGVVITTDASSVGGGAGVVGTAGTGAGGGVVGCASGVLSLAIYWSGTTPEIPIA